jgi:uncharacterized glyoxalase superfamily protein PhnB
MINLTHFLLFDGNCAEAMAFYQSCLGGELTLTQVGDTPMEDQVPPENHHKIIHAHLKMTLSNLRPPIGCISREGQSQATGSVCILTAERMMN